VNVSVAITPLYPIFTYQYEPSQIGAQVDKAKSIRTKAEADQLKAIVQKGGPSQIPVLQRFTLDRASQVTVGTVAAGRIPVTRDALAAVADVRQGQRALLTLKNVDQPAKSDFFVRVFLNAPGTVSAATPITDPHYAGSFAFFVNGGKPMTMSMAGAGFMVDVTEAVRRLGASDGLDIQLVAVPYPGRGVPAAGFSVGGLDLAIAKFAPPPAQA
jgi:tyrosinase